MAGSICVAPLQGRHMRVVKLDECGVPVTGASSAVFVTKGYVQVAIEPQYEDGEEFFERNASGEACVNQKDSPTLKRFQLTIDFCQVDAEMAAFILNARLLTAGAAVTGTGFAVAEGTQNNRFSLEVWQGVAGQGACADGGAQYIYNAFPNVGNAQVGSYTVENGRSTFQIVAETAAAALEWDEDPVPGGGGPWLPEGEVVDDDEHWLWNVTTTALPTEECGPIAWPS